MLLREQVRAQGEALFRRRTVLPFLLVPLGLLALRESRWIEQRFGRGVDDAFEWLCLGISVLGLALRFVVAGWVPRRTSGRNTHKGQVADALNTTGVYSVVRHPLYLANFLIFAGFLVFSGSLWVLIAGSLVFFVYYERIALAEEAFLLERFGDRYRAWADATPAFVPSLRAWRAPALPFCWRSALKREYQTICQTGIAFALLEQLEDFVAHGRFEVEPEPLLLLAGSLLVLALVRLVHKRTRLLNAPGR